MPLISVTAVYMCQTIRFLTLWQSWYNSSRTSRFSFCGSYKRWFCVCKCMCMCACLPEHNEGRSHPTLPVQQQQQRYNTSESRKAHINRNACVVPFQLATPPGFQVSRIPKETLYVYAHVPGHFFCTSGMMSTGRGSFLALSAAGHSGGLRVH